jgi:hypothetical protein
MQNIYLKTFFLLLLVAGLAVSPASGYEDIEITVVAEKAPVRLNPDSTSPVIETLQRGAVVKSMEKSGEWYAVELLDSEQGYSRMGYIHQSQVRSAAEAEPEAADRPEQSRPRSAVRRPAVTAQPARQQRTGANRLYVNGNFGFGIGFSKIKVGSEYRDGEKSGDINIHPGGGAALRIALGYRFLNTLMFELGVNYQTSGESFANGKVYFSRVPISAEIKYLFPGDSFRIFAGAGPVFFLGANLDLEEDNRDSYISYNSPFGIIAEIGGTTEEPGKSLYFFGSAGYMGAFGEYSWQDSSFLPVYRLRDFSAHGIFLNIGIGYFLN